MDPMRDFRPGDQVVCWRRGMKLAHLVTVLKVCPKTVRVQVHADLRIINVNPIHLTREVF